MGKVDMGYDISDYEKVYLPYGSVKDMEDLIEACHKRYGIQRSTSSGRNQVT
jgi:glycosidase